MKIIGMGNALVDIVTLIDSDDVLANLNIQKGSMQLVDKDISNNIYHKTKQNIKRITSGGSAANTIYGLANLGIETAFIGKLGKDDLALQFKNDLSINKITPKLFESDTISGRAIALISPDSERTFATFLGAAVELIDTDLASEIFEGYDLLHIEGYLVQNYKLIEIALKLAKENGLTISLDLASYNIVLEHHSFLKRIVSEYVDILFANEEEARAFTGKQPEEALEEMAKLCKIAVVKIGKDGSLIKQQNQKHIIDIIPATRVDTTGAGDLYASGFLYGWSKNLPLDICGKMGTILSGKIIEILGAKFENETWADLQKMIKELE